MTAGLELSGVTSASAKHHRQGIDLVANQAVHRPGRRVGLQ
jgi:hypothetical protein